MANDWLMLIYKIPREPTAGRVYIWRKLKQLGAFALQDAVWALPHSSRTQEQFQWLAAEISEIGGESLLFHSEQLYATHPERLREQFEEPVAIEYREILAALKKKGCDLGELSKRFQRAQGRDFFGSELGHKVRARLLAIGGGNQP